MATPAPTTQVADNSAFGGPNATQAAAANAALATTTPATVPTKAPTGQTSTTAPVSSPTTIVSSQPAAQQVNQKILPTLTQAKTDIATQQTAKAAITAAAVAPTTDTAAKKVAPTATTPEETIANTPDAGHQFAYDAQGNRVQVQIGNMPPGYTTTNPTVAPTQNVADQATDTVGNTYKQFADGTYGKFDATGAYQGAATAQDFQSTKDGQGIFDKLNQALNGSYPLTANQQAQVDGIKQQFQTLIDQQKVANANFTGGTTVAENLYGMGNSLTGLGQIKGTVDAGIAKIADLNSKMNSAVTQMESAFQQDNLNLLKTAYDIYSTAVKSRQDEIDKLHAVATQAATDARDYNLKVQAQKNTETNNQRTYNLEVQKEADNLAQNAITNKREDSLAASTIAKNNADIQKIHDAKIGVINLPGQAVTDVNGNIDPAKQAAFLQNIAKQNPGLALAIKAAANYQLDPTKFASMRTDARQAFMEQVLLYNPTFDQQQYQTRHALITNFASGQYSQNVNALNTASGHIATIASDISKLGNTNFGPANVVKNTVGPIFGMNSTAGAKLDIGAVTGELASSFKKSGATDQEIASLGTINSNSTPNDIKAYVSSATHLMASKLGALSDTYTAGVGTPPSSPLLHPDAVAALSTLKNQGYDVQIPGVPYTDKDAYMKNVSDAATNLQNAYQSLKDAGMPTTPENILQAAQLNN